MVNHHIDPITSIKYLELTNLAVTQRIGCKNVHVLFQENCFSPVHGLIISQK